MKCPPAILIGLAFVTLVHAAADQAPPEQKPRAARSVHLWYKAPDSVLFYNEVTVEESYPGSYFCVCGFRHGYFGIQELTSGGRKVVIFSVWDPGGQNNPNEVDAENRVKVIHSGQDVRISRFGNEGTGGKSMFRYQWKTGQTYRCLVKATVEGDRTTYAAYFYLSESKKWKHLASFQTITKGDYLKGYYSFIEDFYRNGTSATQRRRARFGNGWVHTTSGDWIALARATFTADRTPTYNIDAGVVGDEFYLATGGDVRNSTPLRTALSRVPAGLDIPGEAVPTP
jgi:hypothetical protein